MVVEVAGAAFPITPLLSTCTKIVNILHNVGQRFNRAPLMMTSVATECELIHAALCQLRGFDWAAITADAKGSQEQLTRATESIILGCTLTLSVIEEYAIELQDYVEGAPISPTEQMGIMARVRILWKEDEMRELLLQLRGYQTGLTGLIRAAHDSEFTDESEALGSTSNCTALLQRSRSSRARKPLSIQAAMQHAATYSHAAHRSGASHHTTYSSLNTGVSRSLSQQKSSPRLGYGDGVFTVTGESHDGGMHAPSVVRKGSSGTRKRPAFLNLAPEEPVAVVDGRMLHTKKSLDQMRKSSPTVGERFQFTPGHPPVPAIPIFEQPLKSAPPVLGERSSPVAIRFEDKPGKSASKESLLHEPPSSAPPQGPLPEPPIVKVPSRSPSRSHSPPKSPIKSILRNGSTSHRRQGSASPQLQHQADMSNINGAPVETYQPKRVPHSPTPSIDRTFRATPSHSSLQHPRKQRSTSSVRDQIIMLPESARLRKQASADLLRHQSSMELVDEAGLNEVIPAMPTPRTDRYVMGNAFGRRGSSAQSSLGQVSRSPSYDLLTDAAKKRSVADLVNHASRQEAEAEAIQRQTGATHSRSASGSRRPAHLKYLNVEFMSEDGLSPTSDAATTPSTIPTPNSQHAVGGLDSWPLTSTQDAEHDGVSKHTRHVSRPSVDSLQRRSPTQLAGSLSPNATPRASHSMTSLANTPRQRSRSNTLLTIGSEQQGPGDGQSTHGSVAPSIMSAQWHRTPQERLDIGPRVNLTEAVPWEVDGDDKDNAKGQDKALRSPKAGAGSKFAGVPTRKSSRTHTLIQPQSPPHSPPRSPLLTDGFLSNVDSRLPNQSETRQVQDNSQPAVYCPTQGLKSAFEDDNMDEVNTPRLTKDKSKKGSSRSAMKQLWGAYKDSPSTWYVAQIKRGTADELRAEARARDDRSSMDVSCSSRTTRESMDRTYSLSSTSANSNRMVGEKGKKKRTGFMKAMFSSTNTRHS